MALSDAAKEFEEIEPFAEADAAPTTRIEVARAEADISG